MGRPARPQGAAWELEGVDYAYLVYPHKPILAYLPQTGQLLNEYCVEFPDETRPYGSPRLPDSDDVLAKWMALKGDERRLISEANLHLPGRQVDTKQVQRDLWRLGQWERERLARAARASTDPRVTPRRDRRRVVRPMGERIGGTRLGHALLGSRSTAGGGGRCRRDDREHALGERVGAPSAWGTRAREGATCLRGPDMLRDPVDRRLHLPEDE